MVIFPDVEKILVAGLRAAIDVRTESYTNNVFIATKKPGPKTNPYPNRIITIRTDGGPQLDDVRKMERIGLTVYATTYEDASDLSRLVGALVRTLTGEYIKLVEVILSPVRVDEESQEEVRYMTLEVITKGTTL